MLFFILGKGHYTNTSKQPYKCKLFYFSMLLKGHASNNGCIPVSYTPGAARTSDWGPMALSKYML